MNVLSLKEKFREDANGVVRVLNFVADSARICIDLVVVATGLTLVTKEVNLIELFFNILKAEALVPALREYIKRDLSTDGEGQVITELGLQLLNKGLSHICGLIEMLELFTFLS
jgi:hypothetical protein